MGEINGVLYDWGDVEIQLVGGETVALTEISYSDELPREARYGKGVKPRGSGRKNYKASCSATMDKDEFERLKGKIGPSIYNSLPFVISISYGNNLKPRITDTLKGVTITKVDSGAKQGDDNVGVIKLDFFVQEPIEWGGVPAV